jgi:hypothetical protein
LLYASPNWTTYYYQAASGRTPAEWASASISGNQGGTPIPIGRGFIVELTGSHPGFTWTVPPPY